MDTTLRIDGERLWDALMEMATIGATAKGGVNRLALSDTDREGRNVFIQWCKSQGCKIEIDQMGNIFAQRQGRDASKHPILIGSHLDSQPTGGKYDGVYGVLAGLEVIKTLNEHQIETKHPIELVSWTNEEGARFAPAMIGSGVFAGAFDLEYAYKREDQNGFKLGEELDRINYKGTFPMGKRSYTATFELHIEQGPILEAENLSIGVVTGVQGIRWYDMTIKGKETHAGPSPMRFRRDPVKAALPVLEKLYKLEDVYGEDARITIGNIRPNPGVRNTVAGILDISVDLRHPDAEVLKKMDQEFKKIIEEGQQYMEGIKINCEEIWYSPPVQFDENCISAVKHATKTLGIASKNMVSGAGHDAVYISRVAPTSMIFIPCRDGLSHNELEHIEKQHAIDGANVLLQTILQTDNK